MESVVKLFAAFSAVTVTPNLAAIFESVSPLTTMYVFAVGEGAGVAVLVGVGVAVLVGAGEAVLVGVGVGDGVCVGV